jgi:microcystin-dependent protein
VFFSPNLNVLAWYGLGDYYRQNTTPSPTGANAIWYNTDNNTYRYTENFGSTWTTIRATEIGRFTTNTSGVVDSFNPYHPLSVATEDDIVALQNKIKEELEKRDQAQIGVPQFTLDFTGSLPDNCIDLNGAEVSRVTYVKLFAIYGTTYGAGDGSTTFNLPDFRGRVIYGDVTSGYVSPELPDHQHAPLYVGSSNADLGDPGQYCISNPGSYNGVQTNTNGYTGNVRNNSIFKTNGTVKTAGVKARVYTRYQ